MRVRVDRILRWCIPVLAAAAVLPGQVSAAWEPTKTVEFIIPAGTGGGADQMARAVLEFANVQLLEFKCVEFSEELLYGDLVKKTE